MFCDRLAPLNPGKDTSPGRMSHTHSLVAASSFHDWIPADRDPESQAGQDVTHYTPTQYFKSLRMNGTISEIEPLEDA